MGSQEDILNLDPSSEKKIFKKGDIVQKANSLKAYAIFVTKGILRSYIIDSKGKEHIYAFASEGWIIGDIEAMEYHQPTQLIVDCIEDSEVVFFDTTNFLNPDLNKEHLIANMKLLSRRIGRLQRRVLMLMGAPAIDRYQYFLDTYPELQNRIPQKMIAAFLGIAPQTLSTIRSKLAQPK